MVKGVRLDEILLTMGEDEILLLKVDTEGHEIQVFEGLQKFPGPVHNIIVEVKRASREKRKWLASFEEKYIISSYQETYMPRSHKWNVEADPKWRIGELRGFKQYLPSTEMPKSEDHWLWLKNV